MLKVHIQRVLDHLRLSLNHFCESRKISPSITAESSNEVFKSLDLTVHVRKSNHSHGYSAAVRTTMETALRYFCLRLGTEQYSISMSARDQRDGIRGSRLHYWAKDCDKAVRSDEVRGVITMTDVDYHKSKTDLEGVLYGASQPVVLATINPQKVASSTGEATYFFNTKNEISMRYSGGASYTHRLYDYTPDFLTVTKTLFGITIGITQFKVEKRQLDGLRALVCLSPVGTWTGVSAIVMSFMLSGTRLKHLTPVSNGWALITSLSREGLTHSLGEAGTYSEASFTGDEWVGMGLSDRISKLDPNVGSAGQWLDGDRNRAVVAAAYLRAGGAKPAYVSNVLDSVKHVSCDTKTLHDEGEDKVTVQAFMSPIVEGGAYAHTRSNANNRWAVESRLLNVQSKPNPVSPFCTKVIGEFISHIFSLSGGALTPVSLDTVRANQTRSSQRARHEAGANAGPAEDCTITAFNKAETVDGPNDPRNISTFAPGISMEYSTYTYAITSLLKKTKWYAFKTPPEIAARVAELVTDAEYVVEGDFSRMDGHVNEHVRLLLEEGLLRRLFPGDEEVIRLHGKQYNQHARTKGFKYEQGWSRGSGSPETSVFNTTLTACVKYLSYRMLGYETDEAWNALGLYGGDDALDRGIPEVTPEFFNEIATKAARNLGQVLTGDVRRRHEPVMFLSRNFGGAWYGSDNSIADVRRVLLKIHTTANMQAGVTPAMKCYQKGSSLYLCDANTPILGKLAEKMMTVPNGTEKLPLNADRACHSWWDQFETSWPNKPESWMEEHVSLQLPNFDMPAFDKWVQSGDVLSAPVCDQTVGKSPKRDVMVDGELVRGPPSKGPRKENRTGRVRRKGPSSDAGSVKTV